MKISFASLLLIFLIHQPSFAGPQCPDLSGVYESCNQGSWKTTAHLKQNRCDSLDTYLVSGGQENLILMLKMDGRPLYDKQFDRITISKWIANTLSYDQYEDVSRYGYSRYRKASLTIDGNGLKWSTRQFVNGKLIGQGTSYSRKINSGTCPL